MCALAGFGAQHDAVILASWRTQVCHPDTNAATQGTALTPREMAQRETLVAPPVAALLRRLAGRSTPRIVLGAPLRQAVCAHCIRAPLQQAIPTSVGFWVIMLHFRSVCTVYM